MWVQDKIKDYSKYESLSFIRLPGRGRSADLKALFTLEKIERLGYRDIFEWSRSTSTEDVRVDVVENERGPLSEQLEVFLDLVSKSSTVILHSQNLNSHTALCPRLSSRKTKS